MTDRLFVPLNTEPYRWYEAGDKDIELRGVDARFNPDTVRSGRRVELRRGYSTDDSLWGEIGDVLFVHWLGWLAPEVWPRIDPETETREAFERRVHDLLGTRERYVAFEVVLDDE